MKNEIVNTSGRRTEAASAMSFKATLAVDTILSAAARLWLLTAFVATIFWLPPL